MSALATTPVLILVLTLASLLQLSSSLPKCIDANQAPSSCGDGMVPDCSDKDCCPKKWINDGVKDCNEQTYGCDLSCYCGEECVTLEKSKGCDGIPGSGAERDGCGVCAGDGTTCFDVQLSLAGVTQKSAVVKYVAPSYFRGYQFYVSGVTLTNFAPKSGFNEITTVCSSTKHENGGYLCIGYGLTPWNLPPSNAGNPNTLLTLEYVPETSNSDEIILHGIVAANKFEYVQTLDETRSALPVPSVSYFFDEVAMQYSVIGVKTSDDIDYCRFVVTMSGDRDMGIVPLLEGVEFSANINVVTSGESTTEVVVELTSGSIPSGFFGPVLRITHPNMPSGNDVGDEKIAFKSEQVESQPRSLITIVPDFPKEPRLIPTLELSFGAAKRDEVDVMYMSRVPLRGYQFLVRGVDDIKFKADTSSIRNVYDAKLLPGGSEHYGSKETRVLAINMEEPYSVAHSVATSTKRPLLTLKFDKQAGGAHIAIATAVSAGGRQGSETHLVVTSKPKTGGFVAAKVPRCDTKHEGICDMEDDDGDGCINLYDYAPKTPTLGCDRCGDVDRNNEYNIDILDIVMTVNYATGYYVWGDGTEAHPVADINGDGKVNVHDIVIVVGWVVDPLGDDAHPKMPNCIRR